MEFFFYLSLLVFSLAFLYGLSFSCSQFWVGLKDLYSCTQAEFKESNSLKVAHRFVYYEDGRWTSNNVVVTKVSEQCVYFGPDQLFRFSIKPLKIRNTDLVFDGYKRYGLKKRFVYKVRSEDSLTRMVALPREVVDRVLLENQRD